MATFPPLWSHRLSLLALICFLRQAAASGVVKYCSNLNTGSSFSAVYDQYQSYGACYGTCALANNYAFAIILGYQCWCSDYAPAVTTDSDDCTSTCPGYKDDICGGPDDLFVYYQMNKLAAGTKGGSTSRTSSSQTKQSSTTTPPPTVKDTTTSPSWTPTPSISLETVNEVVRTVTVTPTIPPASASTNTPIQKSGGGGGGLGTGGAVGLAIGLIALFAIIAGVAFWFWRKKKRQDREAEEERRNMEESKRSSSAGLRPDDMTRTMSQHSRFVLGSNGKTVVGGFEPVTPTVETSGSSRLSTHGLKPVDPRLDPFGVAYGNRSRESLNTINDGHDYTRKILRTTNPDPDNDD